MSIPTTTSALVASANIGRVGQPGARASRNATGFDDLVIGQHLRMQVLRQLEQQRYEVTFGGRRHVVESRVPLEAGTFITARVEGKGEKLELRYLEAGARFEQPEACSEANPFATALAREGGEGNDTPHLNALAAQYRVPLDARARETIARAAAKVADPDLMTRTGLFLQKLARQVDVRDLEALYRALGGDQPGVAAAAVQSPIDVDDLNGQDEVATTLADVLDAMRADAGALQVQEVEANSDSHDDGGQDAQRALRLLNLQDDGAVAWRFGTLPLLVGGQLIELDLVMFRERDAQAKRGALRRLVMTLDTTHFGRVHVEARAVDSRLTVTLSAASGDAVEVLSAYGADVRTAIEQLGWAVDDVRYEISATHASAAQSVIQHVLSAGTVDQEL
jgi:hypothetical protein